ncbi:hypothetical protein N7492_001603 [Penicillium capsulatum]|uniref:DJ-1/PfpI domain-containing protein n=1 Tax=Penicillium capsulatum TaxID=69766 RepID=A0A9W9IU47_9EURO|nr:hypothetical protein N7492_001603 [Penicillium capsulatum]KAJ6129344.1 hypothetical protein N7512_002124 [Penicillium capsulatum]
MADPLRVGVLLMDRMQLLDLAPVDLLYMTKPDYLKELGMPKPIRDLGRPCEIYYIGPKNSSKIQITSFITMDLTSSVDDPRVAPGKLDLIYIPGPSPHQMPPPREYLEFLQQHEARGVTILSVCTGSLIVAHAGLTRGKTATAPRFLIPDMRKQFPETKQWDENSRFTRDGKLYMSGGITNGNDAVAQYLRDNYAAPLVNTILHVAEIDPRPTKYSSHSTRDVLYIVLQAILSFPHLLLQMFRAK